MDDASTPEVLSDINLTVQRGECFVIIGPNGSGKTTLLRILGLLENPTGGKILYENEEITNLRRVKKVKYRRKFSFVKQKPVVRNTSVFNNVAFGFRIRHVKYQKWIDKVNTILQRVGLDEMKKLNARSLSGGEMQRVAIAMNFVLDPELYLLDEVSANLDPVNIKLLDEFISEIKENKKKTIIMSTHDRFEAIKYADRIAVLNNGIISQIGSPNDVFKSPKDEFTAQFVGYENVFNGTAYFNEESKLTNIKIKDLTIFASHQTEGNVKICIHPESIIIANKSPEKVSTLNVFEGNVDEIRDLGNICHVIIESHSEKFLSTITKTSCDKLDLKPGKEVYINFKATDVKCL